MSLLKEAKNEQAYLKAGLLGFAKSGKSYTASRMAVGLHKLIKSQKPVAFLDTETGSSYILNLFKEEGIQLLTAKSRAFVDLMAVCNEAEKTCDILIIDSITHFWIELVKAFGIKLKRDRLRIWDWKPIKEEWQAFTDFYINSKLHIIMCGRAGWEYGEVEDADGILEQKRTGIKMKAESDMSFEPSLLIEMEKVRAGTGKAGQEIVHRAWVIGDRFHDLTGKSFDNPKFENFLPHILKLNLGGDHVGIEVGNSSQDLFEGPGAGINIRKRREIALENIQNELIKRYPGRKAEEVQAKLKILEEVFFTGSWTAISDFHPDMLEAGLIKISKIKEAANG